MTTTPAPGPPEAAFPGSSSTPGWPHELTPVGTTADTHIRRLQRGYRDDRADAVATLARIRRGAGRPAGTVPDLWGLTGMEHLLETSPPGLIEEAADEALHIAVTLWGLHQQAHRDADMHVRGVGLGAAVRKMMPDDESGEPIRKRFVRAAAAHSTGTLAERLRELVLLLRKEALPLDYGLLADQLYRWQRPGGRSRIHREWGRDFHRAAARRADVAKGPAPRPPRSTTATAPTTSTTSTTDRDIP